MKPLDGSFASNALEHGVAGLNIEAARVGTESITVNGYRAETGQTWDAGGMLAAGVEREPTIHQGRWPANVIHDGSDEVAEQFPDTTVCGGQKETTHTDGMFGIGQPGRIYNKSDGDDRSAARFFKECEADDMENDDE